MSEEARDAHDAGVHNQNGPLEEADEATPDENDAADTSDFASAAQGSLADSAVQPGDPVSVNAQTGTVKGTQFTRQSPWLIPVGEVERVAALLWVTPDWHAALAEVTNDANPANADRATGA